MRWEEVVYKWTLQQKRSVLYFLVCIASLLFTYFFLPRKEYLVLDIESAEVQNLLLTIEEQRKKDSSQITPARKPFNPNFITKYQADLFGIDSSALAAIKAYRESGQWINSVADFQNLTQIEDAKLKEIQSFLRFPEWVVANQAANPTSNVIAPKIIKKDLNLASREELMIVPGIGEVLSSRVIEWRERLHSFSDTLQLLHVNGLNDWTRANLWKYFYINPQQYIIKINLKEASVSDLETIPGVDFEMARKLWEFNRLEGDIFELEDLIKIEGMTLLKLKLIGLYLYIQ